MNRDIIIEIAARLNYNMEIHLHTIARHTHGNHQGLATAFAMTLRPEGPLIFLLARACKLRADARCRNCASLRLLFEIVWRLPSPSFACKAGKFLNLRANLGNNLEGSVSSSAFDVFR